MVHHEVDMAQHRDLVDERLDVHRRMLVTDLVDRAGATGDGEDLAARSGHLVGDREQGRGGAEDRPEGQQHPRRVAGLAVPGQPFRDRRAGL